ncbi:MAG: cyclic nucleotide-binding domain-containing protein [Myxococcales bacterium]|nr:cyclic nucleotide-binding domain-containing protein [Myxococcales bacterium]
MSDDRTRRLGPTAKPESQSEPLQLAVNGAESDTLAHESELNESVRVHAADGQPSTQRSATVPVHRAERFEDQGEIARGGMGVVHRVFDHALLRTVAEKRLHDSVRLLPGAAARFLEEAQITGQLDHPNIVPVHDIGVDEDGAVNSISMKWVKGQTLKELIARAHTQGLTGSDIEELLEVFLKLCDAVAFAHSRGVVHRDLKPDNVMVGSHGQVYVMDWGIARLSAGARPSDLSVDAGAFGAHERPPAERSRAVLGTPAYMAPEQADGRVADIDERTDVFGLGAILYRILTGRAPHAASTSEEAIEKSIRGQIEHPEKVVTHLRLPPGLVRIAMKALSRDPAARYPSVEELHVAISDFMRGGGWFRTHALPAGTVIVREGDQPDAAYIINSGRCEAYRVRDGKRESLRIMHPGEAFGEAAIFADQPRTASVVALDDVEVMEITLDALEQECGPRSWMRTFVTALAERFLDANRELTELKKSRVG